MDTLARGGFALLLADFDGTLVPIAPRPEQVVLEHSVRDHLAGLARSPRVRVGILSGRALADVRARVALPELIYAGCHGLEVDGPGVAFTHPDAESLRRRFDEIGQTLRRRVGSIPGVIVEQKGLGIALHYRNAAPDTAPRLEAEAAEMIGRWNGLTLLGGKKVIEIVPDLRWNKGECALWLRDSLFRDATGPVTVMYMGDDETDELAFTALAGKALTVRVGSEHRASAASYRLRDVSDVHGLLSALAADTRTVS
jgi:trehalose-phosphatase